MTVIPEMRHQEKVKDTSEGTNRKTNDTKKLKDKGQTITYLHVYSI